MDDGRQTLGGSLITGCRRPARHVRWRSQAVDAGQRGLAWSEAGSLRAAFPQRPAVPSTDFISAERKFAEVCVFARLFAELGTQPTMRHQAKTSSTLVAELRLPHSILAHYSLGDRACELGQSILFQAQANRTAFAGRPTVRPNLWPQRLAGSTRALRLSTVGP